MIQKIMMFVFFYISDDIFEVQHSSGAVIALAVFLSLSLLTNVFLWICYCRKR